MVLIIVDIPSTYMFPLWKTIYPAKEEKTHQHLPHWFSFLPHFESLYDFVKKKIISNICEN